MTSPNQRDLDETTHDLHQLAGIASVTRRALRAADHAAVGSGTEGHAIAGSPAVGVWTATHGLVGTAEGVTAFRAAAEREREARAAGDTRGVENAREDEVNAGASTVRGALTAASGAATTFGRSAAGRTLSRAAGVVQVAQGAHNLYRGVRNWNRDPARSGREVSDAVLNVAGGGLSIAGTPVATAAATGIALGTLGRETADAYAQQTGVLGHQLRTARRGVQSEGSRPAAENLSATDAAVETGLDVAGRLGGGTGARIAGGAATVAAAPLTVGATLALQGINAAAGATPDVTGDLAAEDAELRGAPLAATDRSRAAEHRRRIRQRQAQQAAAQQAEADRLRAQIAADGHHDVMAPERSPANAQFTAINASNAQAIERRALGMGPSRDDIERGVLEALDR